MKNIIFTIVLSALSLQISYGQSDPPLPPRDVLPVQGVPNNSHDWFPEIEFMRAEGYLIRDAFSPSWFDFNAILPLNEKNLEDMVLNPLHAYEDVLGLGHDVGGLALRGAKSDNPLIQSQILVGTPNRGSKFLRAINNNTFDNKSAIEIWLDDLERWKGEIECPECEVPEAIEEYILANKNQPYSLGAMNDPNAYYQTLPEVDLATTIVIWGDAEGQTLADFMSSRGAGDTDLQQCQDRLKAMLEAQSAHEDDVRLINNIFNLASGIFKTLGKEIKDGPSLSPAGVGELIENIGDIWLANIENRFKDKKAKRELLICELANRMLETQWVINLSGGQPNFTYTYEEGPQYDEELCDYYSTQCQYNSMHPNHASFCYYAEDVYCLQEVLTITYEPHDFVYSKTEQTIAEFPADSDHVIRVEANHLQEQSYLLHKDEYNNIFQGTYGSPFIIPKS